MFLNVTMIVSPSCPRNVGPSNPRTLNNHDLKLHVTGNNLCISMYFHELILNEWILMLKQSQLVFKYSYLKTRDVF